MLDARENEKRKPFVMKAAVSYIALNAALINHRGLTWVGKDFIRLSAFRRSLFSDNLEISNGGAQTCRPMGMRVKLRL